VPAWPGTGGKAGSLAATRLGSGAGNTLCALTSATGTANKLIVSETIKLRVIKSIPPPTKSDISTFFLKALYDCCNGLTKRRIGKERYSTKLTGPIEISDFRPTIFRPRPLRSVHPRHIKRQPNQHVCRILQQQHLGVRLPVGKTITLCPGSSPEGC
jgi:hypothetical protein